MLLEGLSNAFERLLYSLERPLSDLLEAFYRALNGLYLIAYLNLGNWCRIYAHAPGSIRR